MPTFLSSIQESTYIRESYPSSLYESSLEQDGNIDSSTLSDASPERIVILGGGFGGLNAALNLASLPWNDVGKNNPTPKIQIIDRKERFVFLPLLYELCVGDAELEEVGPTYQSLLKDVEGVEFIQADIQGVDAENNLVYLKSVDSISSSDLNSSSKRLQKVEDSTCIAYDALILATGMESNLNTVPGAKEFALPFYTVEDCYELRKRLTLLDNTQEGLNIKKLEAVVVGGGYSGVELALNLMERLGGKDKANVTLIHRGQSLLEGATEFNKNTSIQRLKTSGVQVMTNTSVERIESSSSDVNVGRYDCEIYTTSTECASSTGTELSVSASILLWTAGAKPPANTGALNSIFPRDKANRVVTNNLLRVQNSENVFCIGDAARGKKDPYPGTAQVAMQQAPVVAWNVFSTLRNKGIENDERERQKLLPFRYLDLGNMMTLGSNDASITSLGGLIQLDGPTASVARRLIYAVRMPTVNQAATAAVLSASKKVSQLLSDRFGEKVISSSVKKRFKK